MDADETRIITAFGVEEVLEVYKENVPKYRKYLLQHLDRETILTGREDFPCASIFRPNRMLKLLFILSFRWEMLMRHAVLRAVAPLPLLLMLLALATSASSWARGTCDAGTSFTYSFTSNCSYPIWIGQRSTADSASYPPQGNNRTLAAACTTNADCASGTCDQDLGQCVCSNASQRSGGAACLASCRLQRRKLRRAGWWRLDCARRAGHRYRCVPHSRLQGRSERHLSRRPQGGELR
jgi:hypothetical protein